MSARVGESGKTLDSIFSHTEKSKVARHYARIASPIFMRSILLLPIFCFWSSAAQAEKMSWLANDQIKLGVDLDRGGAITFLASIKDGANVINNYDLGRQVQLSFYSGPVPFETQGQKPAEHWKHIGWNPIQTGDDFKNPSRILSHENDGKRLHLSCVPMQWPLNNVPGDCTFDSWLELEGPVVKARARLTNAREDRTFYAARLQELPAVYANAPFHRVISYQGAKPFTQDLATPVPSPKKNHPWSFWTGTEGWAALLDPSDYGLGLITPGRVHFTGGFAGVPGPNDTHGNGTGYVAGQALEILDHNITFEFRYELVLGSLQDIPGASRPLPAERPASLDFHTRSPGLALSKHLRHRMAGKGAFAVKAGARRRSTHQPCDLLAGFRGDAPRDRGSFSHHSETRRGHVAAPGSP